MELGPFDDGENGENVVGLDEDDGSRGEGGHPWHSVSDSQQPLALVVRGIVDSDPGLLISPGPNGNEGNPEPVTGCRTR